MADVPQSSDDVMARLDTVLGKLVASIRLSERVSVAARLVSRDWGPTACQDTVDMITDFILEDCHE